MRLGPATAKFLAVDHELSKLAASRHIEDAIRQLLIRDPARFAVVFLDAVGCRRLWPGLLDTGNSSPLPSPVATGRVAIMRIRIERDEVPRPAGTDDWPRNEMLAKPGTMNALVCLDDQDWDGARFYVSTPRLMAAKLANKKMTRYSCGEMELRRDWHALNLTEFSCRDAGPFDPEDLYELSALLCRFAPTWEGTLNWPSPLHLARAIVLDHPGPELQSHDGDDG